MSSLARGMSSGRPTARVGLRVLTLLLAYTGLLILLLTSLRAQAQIGEAEAGSGALGATSAPSSPPLLHHHTLPKKRLPIEFVADENSPVSDLTVYIQPGIVPRLGPGGAVEGPFEPLCRIPCQASLRSGTHVFGVGYSDKPVRKLDHALSVRRGQRVVLRYQRRFGLRLLGWVVLLGSMGASSAMIALGQRLEQPSDKALLISGSLLAVLGLGGGLWLANLPDRATGWVEGPTP